MLDKALADEVMAFTAKQVGVRPGNLSLDTRLLHDLDVDGDDGLDFMECFARGFEVDLSAFDPTLHFGSEGGWNPLSLLACLFPATGAGLIPITLADLVEAARTHLWSTPNRTAV